MEEKIEEAVEYANSSNTLEDNDLSFEELDKIVEDIKNGTTDESFLFSVVRLVEKHNQKNEETEDVKTRKWFV